MSHTTTPALLDGSVVLITGGSAGQGRQHALTSAQAGADVIVVDVHPEGHESYQSLVSEIAALGRRAVCVQADVAERAMLDTVIAAAVKQLGRLNAVIVNAGLYRSGELSTMPHGEWDLVMRVNLLGVWNTISSVSQHFDASLGGSIVVIGSVDGIDLAPQSGAYGVSKAAVHSLTRYAAAELGSRGVRVNAVAPGMVDTPMVNSQRFLDKLAGGEGLGTRQHVLDYAAKKSVIAGRTIIQSEEIANVALFLNSSLASAITGAVIPVDAGYLLLPHAATA